MFQKIAVFFCLLLASCAKLYAQPPVRPADYGLAPFEIQDAKLGTIHFYIDTTNIGHKAPLFIDINGSGGYPLCLYVIGTDHATVQNTFGPTISEQVKDRFHYVILGKPGTPFCDSIHLTKPVAGADFFDILESYKPSAEYNRRLSMQWRINATRKVIGWMIAHGYWDHTKIVAFGFSEGGNLAPLLAVSEPRITHLVSFAGGGLNQFYDRLEGWRVSAAKGEITQQQGQDSISQYLATVKDIFQHPGATGRQYLGHSYKRWASICATSPFEQMRKLSIPIYMVVGTNDTHSPIYGLDYVPLDFLRLGKTNLTYDVCVGCTHTLSAVADGVERNRFQEYFQKVIRWIDSNPAAH